MEKEEIQQIARQWLDSVQSVEHIEEGHLNEVWRATGGEHSCIIKYAPPHVASQPEMSLSQHRAVIESRALTALAPAGALGEVPSEQVKIPEMWDYDASRHVLVMEEIPHQQTLGDLIREEKDVQSALDALAAFIGHLHASTCNSAWAAEHFDNSPMQETRMEVQYRPISDQLTQAGIKDAETLGENARELGEKLLKPGKCLIMGDLWPPSVLVSDKTFYLIDWELAHFGRPLQDIGHLMAHLWLYGRAYNASPETMMYRFFQSYREALGNEYEKLWNQDEWDGMNTHMGAEMIVRTVGAFSDSYLEGQYREGSLHREAIHLSTQLLSGVDPLKF